MNNFGGVEVGKREEAKTIPIQAPTYIILQSVISGFRTND